MATIKQQLVPESAFFKTTNFPQYLIRQGTNFPVSILAFDDTTDEESFWKFKASSYGSGNITLIIRWYSPSATSGNVVWEANLAAITPDTDSQNVETKSFATLNFVQDTHLGTTAQRIHTCSITLSNLDSIAADDEVWLRVARDANGTNATDDMVGDAYLVDMELQYSS